MTGLHKKHNTDNRFFWGPRSRHEQIWLLLRPPSWIGVCLRVVPLTYLALCLSSKGPTLRIVLNGNGLKAGGQPLTCSSGLWRSWTLSPNTIISRTRPDHGPLWGAHFIITVNTMFYFNLLLFQILFHFKSLQLVKTITKTTEAFLKQSLCQLLTGVQQSLDIWNHVSFQQMFLKSMPSDIFF